jgi:hypothetical protein
METCCCWKAHVIVLILQILASLQIEKKSKLSLKLKVHYIVYCILNIFSDICPSLKNLSSWLTGVQEVWIICSAQCWPVLESQQCQFFCILPPHSMSYGRVIIIAWAEYIHIHCYHYGMHPPNEQMYCFKAYPGVEVAFQN